MAVLAAYTNLTPDYISPRHWHLVILGGVLGARSKSVVFLRFGFGLFLILFFLHL